MDQGEVHESPLAEGLSEASTGLGLLERSVPGRPSARNKLLTVPSQRGERVLSSASGWGGESGRTLVGQELNVPLLHRLGV